MRIKKGSKDVQVQKKIQVKRLRIHRLFVLWFLFCLLFVNHSSSFPIEVYCPTNLFSVVCMFC